MKPPRALCPFLRIADKPPAILKRLEDLPRIISRANAFHQCQVLGSIARHDVLKISPVIRKDIRERLIPFRTFGLDRVPHVDQGVR